MSASPHSTSDSYLPDSGDETYGVTHYDLAITYRPASNRLDGVARIDVEAHVALDRLALDLVGLSVDKVSVSGARLKHYSQRRDKLSLSFAQTIKPRTKLRLSVTYSGRPRPVRSPWGTLGWEELREGSLVAGQPIGAPSWFPCNDRPADKATYRIAVTADSPFTVVANGRLLETRQRASTTTWVYDQPEPMATYLATVQIGHYVIRDLAAGRPRQQVAHPSNLADRVTRDFARQDRMMRLFVELFGKYPFRAYTAVITDDSLEIPLEAQGVSIFGSNHVDGKRTYERLVAHELAHQWFGNSLTVARWSDVWLNEGFACYAEWLWSEKSGGPSAQDIAERQWARLRDLPQDLVLADPGKELMFDDRVYKRGALTLHALRTQQGSAAFFDLVRAWTAQHRFGTVSTDAFIAHVDANAGGKSAQLMQRWLYEERLPRLPEAMGR